MASTALKTQFSWKRLFALNKSHWSCHRLVFNRLVMFNEKENPRFSFCFLTDFFVWLLKRCGMGPLLVLVSPWFREDVVVTCKIGSFLCGLDNVRQKNVIVLFFENLISKWRSFEKKGFFTFFSYQGKVTKIPSAHISLAYIHIFCSPYWLFCITNFEKNTNLSGMVSLWYDSWCWFLFEPFLSNQ